MKMICPVCCEYEDQCVSLHFVGGERKLQYFCNNYGRYIGEPFVPPVKEIITSRPYYHHNNSSWTYELYDQYGNAAIFSQGFSSKLLCLQDAMKEKANRLGSSGYETVTVLVWPPSASVKAKVY